MHFNSEKLDEMKLFSIFLNDFPFLKVEKLLMQLLPKTKHKYF